MITAAVYASKSTDQLGLTDEQTQSGPLRTGTQAAARVRYAREALYVSYALVFPPAW